MTLFEKLSNDLASNIAKIIDIDNDRQEVIAYGAYILLDTILAIGMVMIFGAIFGVFYQGLVVSFSSALLRKTSGGSHATTPMRCAMIGALFSVGFALIVVSLKSFITFEVVIAYLILTYAISYFILWRLAPVDSPNKRIVKEVKIKELKLKSIKTLSLYAVICLVILAFSFYIRTTNLLPYIALICTGYLWQAFTLTSLGHLTTYVIESPFRYIIFRGGENK